MNALENLVLVRNTSGITRGKIHKAQMNLLEEIRLEVVGVNPVAEWEPDAKLDSRYLHVYNVVNR